MEYYNIKDTLSNADYNALVYLLRKFKKLTSDLKLGESVIESNYGTFNFSDGFVNMGNNWILDDDVTVTSNDVLKNTFYTFNFTVIDVNTSGVVTRRIVSVTGGTGENGTLELTIPSDLIGTDEVILPNFTVEVVFDEHEYYTPLPDVNVELSSTKEYTGKDESTVITVKLSRNDGTPLSNMLFNMTINEVPAIKKTDEHGECQIQYTGTGNTGKVIFNVLNESLTIHDYESIILTMTGSVVLGRFAYDIYLASEYPLLIDWGDGTSTKIHNPRDVMYHNYSDGETEHTVRILGEFSYIGAHAFDGNDACTKVWMNDSIHTIQNDAFIRNYSLTSVKLPSKLTYLGGNCFRYCGNLLEIELPETISKINAYAFYNCTNLRKYILNWTQNIYRYNISELPVNQDTIFSIPYGTTQDYVDAGYPVSRLVEREPPVFSLILSCDEPIIMKDNVSTVTALLKNNGEGIAGEVLNYVVKHGDSVLDRGSVVTGSDGTASISYTGTGVGDIEVIVSYGTLLQEIYEIIDYWDVDDLTTQGFFEIKGEGSLSYSNDGTQINASYNYSSNQSYAKSINTVPDDFEIDFKLYISESNRFRIILGDTSDYSTIASDSVIGTEIIEDVGDTMMRSNNTVVYTFPSNVFPANQWFDVKLVCNNNQYYCVIDGNTSGTVSLPTGTVRYLTLGFWHNSKTTKIKDLKIKRL